MYVYLSKIVPLFVMPVSIVLLLLIAGLLFLRRERRRAAAGLLVCAFTVLWVCSTPMVAVFLYGRLEASYPPVEMQQVPAAGCIVLLGGAVSPPLPPRVDLELSDAVDRIYQAAALYHAGKARFLVVTAGNQPWSRSPRVEADLMRALLVEWGVPEESIFLEGSSRNTRENAVYSKGLLESIRCETVLLVTSAAHMSRALAAFRNIGLNVTPVSTDVRVTQSNSPSLLDLLPTAGALAMTTDALREWLGLLVYRLRGWA